MKPALHSPFLPRAVTLVLFFTLALWPGLVLGQAKPGQPLPAPAPMERTLDADNATRPSQGLPALVARDLSGLPLPKDLTMIFSQGHLSKMYEQYKEIIWAAMVLAGLQAVIIVALLVSMAGRRKAQEALEQATEGMEARVEERVLELNGQSDGLRNELKGRERAERELRDSVEMLKSILRSIPAGVMIVDPENGAVVDLNPTAVTMCRSRREDMVGQDHRVFLPLAPDQAEPPLAPESGPVAVAGVLAAKDGAHISVARTRAGIELAGHPHILEAFVDVSLLAPSVPAADPLAVSPEKSARRGSEPETFEPFEGSRSEGFGPKDF